MFELWTESLGALDLDDMTNGIVIQKKDFGFPQPRRVQSFRSNAHGVYDNTAYYGDRAISISGVIIGERGGGTVSRSEALAAVRAYCLPGERPQLRFDQDNDVFYTFLTVDNQSVPIESITHYKFTMAWRAPPFVEGAALTRTAGHSGSNDPTNLTFDISFPLDFNDGGSDIFAENVPVTNTGIVPVHPFITITGPVTSPSLNENVLNSSLVFDGLTIGSGESVLVDFEEHTATHSNGDSVLEYIDWSNSDWWTLPVGSSNVSLTGSGYDGDTRITVRWSPRFL